MGSIDLKANDEADANVLVKPEESWGDQEKSVLTGVKNILNNERVDAVICVAGGWAGGNAASNDFLKNSELMWKQSVWSSTIAASIAVQHLKEGLLYLSFFQYINGSTHNLYLERRKVSKTRCIKSDTCFKIDKIQFGNS